MKTSKKATSSSSSSKKKTSAKKKQQHGPAPGIPPVDPATTSRGPTPAAAAAAAATPGSPDASARGLSPAAVQAGRFRKCSVKFGDVETKAGKLGKKYTAFTITMRMGQTTWTLQKRYRDFNALNGRLQKTLHVLKELNFPPKKWFGNLAQKTVQTRKAQLEQCVE